MLNTRLVRAKDADLHFEVMAYLIRQFGAPPRPKVPSPLHKGFGLESLTWDGSESRSVYQWAEDHFNAIKSNCHMQAFNAAIFPDGDGWDGGQPAANHRLDALASGRIPYPKTEDYPIFYDPRNCSDPGHFAAAVILQLAELRVAGFNPDPPLSSLMARMVTLTAAVYNRQGFVLAQLPDQTSAYLTSAHDTRAVPHRLVLNSLCFTTCLALRVRRQSAEQIIATYGMRMTKSFRRKIRQACRQIDAQADALAVLQILAEPPKTYAPSPLSPARSA